MKRARTVFEAVLATAQSPCRARPTSYFFAVRNFAKKNQKAPVPFPHGESLVKEVIARLPADRRYRLPDLIKKAAELSKYEFMKSHFEKAPVVVSDVAVDYEYMQMDFFEKYRKHRVDVLFTQPIEDSHGFENTFSAYKNETRNMPLPEALYAVTEQQDNRGYQVRMDPLPYLVDQELPNFIESMHVLKEQTLLWATSAGHRTPLHSDPWHSMLLHIHGIKRVVLMPPSSYLRNPKVAGMATASGTIEELYIRKGLFGVWTEAWYETELQPGDALYIPKGWYHDIESLNSTLSLSLRFEKRAERRRLQRQSSRLVDLLDSQPE